MSRHFHMMITAFASVLLAVALPGAEMDSEEGRYVEEVTVWAEKAQSFKLKEFALDFVEAKTDIDRVAHVVDMKIERDTAYIHLLDGYVFLQEPVQGRPFMARYAGLGILHVDPPVPLERQNLKKYWGEETLHGKFDRATFHFADDEILAFLQDLDYRPIEEVEEEVKAAQEKKDEPEEGAEDSEESAEEDDEWTNPVKTAAKGRSLFLGMLEQLREGQKQLEKEPLDEEAIEAKRWEDFGKHMEAATKLFQGEQYEGAWWIEARRVVPPEVKKPGATYVTDFDYTEAPHGYGDFFSEEIFLFLKTNWNNYLQMACAYHYLDEYDPDLIYTASSPAIDAETFKRLEVKDINLKAVLRGDRMDGRTIFTLEAFEDNLQLFNLELLPSLDLKRLAWIPPGGTEEEAVPLQIYRPARPKHLEQWSRIALTLLPKPLAKGERARLVAEYEGKVVEEIKSGFYVVPGKFYWFPDHRKSAVTLDVTIWADPKRVVTATGNPVPCGDEMQKPGLLCNRWVIEDPPVHLATFNVASDVKIDTTQTSDGTPVTALAHNRITNNFCYFDKQGHRWCKEYNLSKSTDLIKNVAAAALTIYGDVFGKYPYTKLDLVPWEVSGGQSPPTLVTLSYRAYLTTTALNEIETAIEEQRSRSQSPGRVGYPMPWLWTEIVAHEVSHQWWGHILFWNTYRDQWLSEGMADFSSGYFMEHYDAANGTDYARKTWRHRLETLVQDDQKGETIGPVALGGRMDSPLNPEGFERWYSRKVYNKGAFIVQMLRQIFRAVASKQFGLEQAVGKGDELFFAMMQDFIETYRDTSVSSLQFQKMAEKHLGGELGWFFMQWLYSDGIPKIKWAYEFVPVGDKFKLEGRILQTNTDFQFPVTVFVHQGKKQEPLWFYQLVRDKDFTFETPAVFDRPAASVTLNDDVMLLAEIEDVSGPPSSLAAK